MTQTKLDANDLLSSYGPDVASVLLDQMAAKAKVEKAEAPSDAVQEGGTDTSPLALAQLFLKEGQYIDKSGLKLRYWKEDFYQQTKACFEKVQQGDLKAKVFKVLQGVPDAAGSLSSMKCSSIIDNLRGHCLIEGMESEPAFLKCGAFAPAPSWRSFENGIVDLERAAAGETVVPMPHTPSFFSLASVPYEFKPGAACKNWLEFLQQVLPNEDARRVLQEFFGLCLVHETKYEKMMFMHGQGANGKSVVCLALRHLLGKALVSSLPLEAFNPERTFPLAQMVGKLVNISEDMGEVDRAAEGLIKQCTSGETITVERKYRAPRDERMTARLVFATNTLPRIQDRTDGFWRRLILMPFEVQIPEHLQKRDLRTSEFWEPELPGILNWALVGLARLRAQERFTCAKVCENAKAEYRRDSNPAAAFLAEHFKEAQDAHMTASKVIYDDYRAWCNACGLHPLSLLNLSREIPKVFPKARKSKGAVTVQDPWGGQPTRGHVWYGIEKRPLDQGA